MIINKHRLFGLVLASLFIALFALVLRAQANFSIGATKIGTSQGLPGFVVALPQNVNDPPVYSMTYGYCWKEFPKPRSDLILFDIAVRPRSDGSQRILLAGSLASEGRKAYRSGDLGASWTEIILPPVPSCAAIPAADTDLVGFFPSPANSALLYTIAEGNCTGKPTADGIAVSRDGGVSWNIYRDWPVGEIQSVIPSPVLPNRLYISVFIPEYTWLFFRSDDYGQTFNPSDVIGLPDSQDAQILYRAGQRYIETQGWINWTSQPCSAYTLFAHPTLSLNLLAVCNSSAPPYNLYHSSDGGDSWNQRASASTNDGLIADYGKPGRILWLRDGGMYASENTGTSWIPVVNSWSQLASCKDLFLPAISR